MAPLTSRKVSLRRGPEQEIIQGGEGPALVWLHGLKPARTDDPVLEALAASHAVTAPVMPGQNGLEELDDLATLHDLVLFYDGVLESLGVDRALVVGHSFGAMLAGELAAAAPRRVRGLVLISPLGLWNDDHPVADLFARPYADMEEMVWSGALNRPPQADPADRSVEDHLAMVNALGSVAKYAWPIPDRGLRGRLYRVSAPTLLLFAGADALLPTAYARDFQEELPGARSREIPGGHMVPYEDPAAIAGIIQDFSREISVADAA